MLSSDSFVFFRYSSMLVGSASSSSGASTEYCQKAPQTKAPEVPFDQSVVGGFQVERSLECLCRRHLAQLERTGKSFM